MHGKADVRIHVEQVISTNIQKYMYPSNIPPNHHLNHRVGQGGSATKIFASLLILLEFVKSTVNWTVSYT